MQPIIIVVARAGSKGLKNKHLLDFNGKPLTEWTIEFAAQIAAWGKHEDLYGCDVVVSSDSEQILDIAKKYHAIPFERSAQFATDTAGKVSAIREVGQNYPDCDCVIDFDATNPCRRLEDISNCYDIFKEKRPKTLFSVTKAKKNPFFNQVSYSEYYEQYFTPINETEKPFRGESLVIGKPYTFLVRQDTPEVFDLNANIYIYDSNWLRNPDNQSVITDKSEIYVMPEWTRCDIDSEVDFQVAEFLHKKYILEGVC